MTYQHTLNSINLTLTYVSNNSSVFFPAAKTHAVDGNDSTNIDFTNNQNSIYITYTFETKQLLGKISFIEGSNIRDFEIQVSTNGTDYTTVESITDRNTPSLSEYTLSFNHIKYKSFRLKITDFNSQNNIVLFELRAFAYDPTRKEYNVEFDDSLLDLAGWKNPRYNGSKLIGAKINQFKKGDVSYGLNPVIENKTACIFLGKDIDEGVASNPNNQLVEISNHSYLTINKILFVDLDTDEIEIISRENMSNIAFNRIVAENFPEGSSIVVKSLEDLPEKLKPRHSVKFNQGQLMKVYNYTPNTEGYEDGVFGGIGIRDQKSLPIPNLGNSPSLSTGLFGFGMTATSSASLFTSSIKFTGLLPAELSDYEANYSTETMGSTLCPQIAPAESDFTPGAYIDPILDSDTGINPDDDGSAL